MATAFEIQEAGEKFVVEVLLYEQGYNTRRKTRLPESESTDIEAIGPSHHLLVQVKAAIYPNEPDSLTLQEEADLVTRASEIAAEPFEARVQLDAQLRGKTNPKWRRLI